MAVHFEHSLNVACSPERAFAVVDDFSRTPLWLVRCRWIKNESGKAANEVGDRLRYAYKDAHSEGEMDGELTARVPGERFTMHFWDAGLDVVVDFRMTAQGTGASLTHAIHITPKSFFNWLLSPLIRLGVPKQTIDAMKALKALLEAESGEAAPPA